MRLLLVSRGKKLYDAVKRLYSEVFYMCLAVPVCVTEILPDDMAKVRVGEGETFLTVSTMLLETPPKIGDYMIVHAGFALRVLEEKEASEALTLLKEVAESGQVVEF